MHVGLVPFVPNMTEVACLPLVAEEPHPVAQDPENYPDQWQAPLNSSLSDSKWHGSGSGNWWQGTWEECHESKWSPSDWEDVDVLVHPHG